jgi:UTP-glucose-1-phosphate uridylyltransferase
VYVRQRPVYGNGIPLLDVEHLVGDEPFFYIWSDDLLMSTPPCFEQMIHAYEEFQVWRRVEQGTRGNRQPARELLR